jgi:hypothetical protein
LCCVSCVFALYYAVQKQSLSVACCGWQARARFLAAASFQSSFAQAFMLSTRAYPMPAVQLSALS